METQQAHELRKQINTIINSTKGVVTSPNHFVFEFDFKRTQEDHKLVTFANKKLKYATYWLGLLIHYNGEPKRTEEQYKKEGITDTHEDKLKFSGVNPLPEIREAIQKVIDEVDAPAKEGEKTSRNQARCITNAWTYLCEARFALGELMGELQREAKVAEQETDQTNEDGRV